MAAEKTVQRSTVRSPEEVVRSYFDAVIARDPEAMAEHWADDGIEEILPVGIFRGPEEVKAWFKELFEAVPDFEMTLDRVLAHDNDVLVQWRASGSFTGGPLMGIDPTDRHIELRGLDWLEVEGDKVVRNTAFADGAALARGMGLLPPQGSAAEKAMFTAFNTFTKARGAVSDVLSR
jgi:predicted ester cyclase